MGVEMIRSTSSKTRIKGEIWEQWGATYGRNGWEGAKKQIPRAASPRRCLPSLARPRAPPSSPLAPSRRRTPAPILESAKSMPWRAARRERRPKKESNSEMWGKGACATYGRNGHLCHLCGGVGGVDELLCRVHVRTHRVRPAEESTDRKPPCALRLGSGRTKKENPFLTYGGNGVRHVGKSGGVGEFQKKRTLSSSLRHGGRRPSQHQVRLALLPPDRGRSTPS